MLRRAVVSDISDGKFARAKILEGPPGAASFLPGEEVKVFIQPDVIGPVRADDEILIEVSALAKSLGTGGYATVRALWGKLPEDEIVTVGHIVKDRYTPCQNIVLGGDEPDSPYYQQLENVSMRGVPVITSDLHSTLAPILAGIRSQVPNARIAYLHPDGAALPVSFSKQTAILKDQGWIDTVVSCGQSYGGDLEAVNVHSGILLARAAGADFIVIAQGPGNLGTASTWGFSGLAVGEWLNAAAVLGGIPVACLRLSNADSRPRHLGVSHHTLTALTKVSNSGVHFAVPDFAGTTLENSRDFLSRIEASVETLRESGHIPHLVAAAPLVEPLREVPVKLSTMGRSFDEDPAAFLGAAVAGVLAAQLRDGTQKSR